MRLDLAGGEVDADNSDSISAILGRLDRNSFDSIFATAGGDIGFGFNFANGVGKIKDDGGDFVLGMGNFATGSGKIADSKPGYSR